MTALIKEQTTKDNTITYINNSNNYSLKQQQSHQCKHHLSTKNDILTKKLRSNNSINFNNSNKNNSETRHSKNKENISLSNIYNDSVNNSNSNPPQRHQQQKEQEEQYQSRQFHSQEQQQRQYYHYGQETSKTDRYKEKRIPIMMHEKKINSSYTKTTFLIHLSIIIQHLYTLYITPTRTISSFTQLVYIASTCFHIITLLSNIFKKFKIEKLFVIYGTWIIWSGWIICLLITKSDFNNHNNNNIKSSSSSPSTSLANNSFLMLNYNYYLLTSTPIYVSPFLMHGKWLSTYLPMMSFILIMTIRRNHWGIIIWEYLVLLQDSILSLIYYRIWSVVCLGPGWILTWEIFKCLFHLTSTSSSSSSSLIHSSLPSSSSSFSSSFSSSISSTLIPFILNINNNINNFYNNYNNNNNNNYNEFLFYQTDIPKFPGFICTLIVSIIAGVLMICWWSFWTFQIQGVLWKKELEEGVVVWSSDGRIMKANGIIRN